MALNAAKLTHAMSSTTATPGAPLSEQARMLDVLQGFVHELRAAGLPVSMTENLDAMRALEHIPFGERDALKAALGATLVKHVGHTKVFDTVFDVYFSLFSTGIEGGEAAEGEVSGDENSVDWDQMRAAMQGAGAMGEVSNEDLARMLLDALMKMDQEALRA